MDQTMQDNSKRPGKGRRIMGIAAVLLLLITFCLWQNNALVITEYAYSSAKIPAGLDGFTIALVSDLHNKDFGGRLTARLQAAEPDLIAVTGDLIDCRRTDLPTALALISAATEIAPVYYVPGNHEAGAGADYDLLRQQMLQAGATVLAEDGAVIEQNGACFNLIGISDQAFGYDGMGAISSRRREEMLNVLLAHRPEQIREYAGAGAELVLSGHAHGGQWRLPGLGGLIALGQGLFPRYTTGPYWVAGATLIVSRGLGNSVMPIRLFNRPELVLVRLRAEAAGQP